MVTSRAGEGSDSNDSNLGIFRANDADGDVDEGDREGQLVELVRRLVTSTTKMPKKRNIQSDPDVVQLEGAAKEVVEVAFVPGVEVTVLTKSGLETKRETRPVARPETKRETKQEAKPEMRDPPMATQLEDGVDPGRLKKLPMKTKHPPRTMQLVDGAKQRPSRQMTMAVQRPDVDRVVAKAFSCPESEAASAGLKGEMEIENIAKRLGIDQDDDVQNKVKCCEQYERHQAKRPQVQDKPPTRLGEMNDLVRYEEYNGWLVYERGGSGVNTEDVEQPSRGAVSWRETVQMANEGHELEGVVTADDKARKWQERNDTSWKKLDNTAHTTAGDIVQSEQMITKKTDLITELIKVRKYWKRYNPTEESGDTQAGEPDDNDSDDEDPDDEKDPKMSKRPKKPKRIMCA